MGYKTGPRLSKKTVPSAGLTLAEVCVPRPGRPVGLALAALSGDGIEAENYYQHPEHCLRLMQQGA